MSLVDAANSIKLSESDANKLMLVEDLINSGAIDTYRTLDDFKKELFTKRLIEGDACVGETLLKPSILTHKYSPDKYIISRLYNTIENLENEIVDLRYEIARIIDVVNVLAAVNNTTRPYVQAL